MHLMAVIACSCSVKDIVLLRRKPTCIARPPVSIGRINEATKLSADMIAYILRASLIECFITTCAKRIRTVSEFTKTRPLVYTVQYNSEKKLKLIEKFHLTREIDSRLIDSGRPYFYCFLLYPSDYYALIIRFCFTS